MSRVFIIDDRSLKIDLYRHIFAQVGAEVFFTENAYRFVRYAQELHPDLYLINADMRNTNAEKLIEYMHKHALSELAPLIITSKRTPKFLDKGISHHIKDKNITTELPELAQTYCRGGYQYDVLLLEKEPQMPLIPTVDTQKDWSCFKVYDPQGARLFLQKNQSRIIAVHCPTVQFQNMKKTLQIGNVVHIENVAYLNNLVSFIK